MKVSELIHLLLKQNPDAEILIMSLRNWPWESALERVTVRHEIVRAAGEVVDDDEESLDDDGLDDGEPTRERGTEPCDVLLVEGELRRYGSRPAWKMAPR